VLAFTPSILSAIDTTDIASQVDSSAQVSHFETKGQENVESHGSIGSELPLWSVIPFVGILLSIAIFPLVAPKFWHHHFGKVSLFWAFIIVVPFVIIYKSDAVYEILHVYLLEYIPFIVLLWSLFTVAGGIYIKGAPMGTPTANTVLLIIGTAIASWIGTTGASMVLIRPLIRMNEYRKSKLHLILFFIFLVSNIGGSLTPLGDPPLFLGFLNHVPFFWTFNLFKEMFFVSVILIALFYFVDLYMYRKEGSHKKIHLLDHDVAARLNKYELELDEEVEIESQNTHLFEKKKMQMKILGLTNIPLLLGVIGGVLFSGFVHLGEVNIGGVHVTIEGLMRDGFLVLMGLISLKITPGDYRKGNEFSWFPIVEVAKLFAGIFMTMIPALVMLRAGLEGNLKFIIAAVKEPWHYFWITGTLSSFLDNAPTYLTFLSTACGQFYPGTLTAEAVPQLISQNEIYLVAISIGAVFFGAMTYIGNAPNFMVRSIAEEAKIKMPSFFGYMIYSVIILVPLFILVHWIFL
jgi:Na+/H+ antiporter NhaD/arsenite permease-like protein